jgi:hypothetical protein
MAVPAPQRLLDVDPDDIAPAAEWRAMSPSLRLANVSFGSALGASFTEDVLEGIGPLTNKQDLAMLARLRPEALPSGHAAPARTSSRWAFLKRLSLRDDRALFRAAAWASIAGLVVAVVGIVVTVLLAH